MDGDVKDLWIIIRQVLYAISMMNIPIKNQDSVGPTRMCGVFGSYCDIVEITET